MTGWIRSTGLTAVMVLIAVILGRESAVLAQEVGDAKLRVLVDKVLMAHNGWVMSEENVREIAAAGFNVVSPRQGNDDMDEVRRVALLAQKHGIRHMPWMRGTRVAESGDLLVWGDGTVQNLYSPNAEELWDWIEGRILGYARISAKIPELMGVFLDFENYAPGWKGDGYSLSYDNKVLEEFAEARGIEIPELEPKARRRWLEKNELHEQFAEFQIDSWRRRCRQLRQAVDKINPAFRFCVKPAPGTPFIEEAVWKEWGTERAPLILADRSTFGRANPLMGHVEGLAANKRNIERRQGRVREAGVSMQYLGGVDPIVRGADPEYSGKNAVMLAEMTDGYWVFYEGPEYDQEDHAAYWKWFTWANRAIEAGRFVVQAEPRVEADPWLMVDLGAQTEKLQIGLYGLKPRMVELIEGEGYFELHDLRGVSLEYLRQLDVVLLQNFNLDLDSSHPWVRALRAYVREGGGLMLVHDTAWFMASPLPEIAVPGYPVDQVEAVRHVVDRRLQVSAAHPALGDLREGTLFETEFRDHMIFNPGKRGTVVVSNHFGDPVYVVGEFGEGRAVFSGSYYGYTEPLIGTEREAFLACLKWLAEK
ncbi:MAG: hypothetical protein HOC74_08375 [Gemmatimonadetes bacterium]|jgi:hypothetical protein|nr:hypothetical protein [Gemmatimonadota bacterium]